MLKITSKGRYGTRLMLRLALHYGEGPMLLKQIGEIEGISVRFLEQIVPALKTTQLIRSTRGAKGGYALAKAPAEISLRTIIEALEGPIVTADCITVAELCGKSNSCVTREIWRELGDNIASTLDSYTLEDMVNMHRQRNIEASIGSQLS